MFLREGEKFGEVAERIVERAEANYINALFNWETNAQHRKENCKCPQCKKEAPRASHAISNELERVAPRTQWDEEENYE